MKTKGIRFTKDVLDAALARGVQSSAAVAAVIRKKAENMQRLQLIIQTFV